MLMGGCSEQDVDAERYYPFKEDGVYSISAVVLDQSAGLPTEEKAQAMELLTQVYIDTPPASTDGIGFPDGQQPAHFKLTYYSGEEYDFSIQLASQDSAQLTDNDFNVYFVNSLPFISDNKELNGEINDLFEQLTDELF